MTFWGSLILALLDAGSMGLLACRKRWGWAVSIIANTLFIPYIWITGMYGFYLLVAIYYVVAAYGWWHWGARMSLSPGQPGGDSRWVKSSLSFCNSNCVEVAHLADGQIGVRHSKDPQGPVLRFTPGEWRAFLGGVRNGEFGPG